ncbi:alpha-L-rhamnosidase-related protein [Salmonirosea aquatica]|uniref:Glycogen debranching protein n=1 Tax=Salmonirosea aquatica TaxID=2654236 RepID=A0A7C9BH78_9BACT|nr:glycogen debranching protein [Cytophagaceae bacterium SJW1-29]
MKLIRSEFSFAWVLVASMVTGFLSCSTPEEDLSQVPISRFVADVDSLIGKPEYLGTPYVTAGDRLYMIGTQDGKFPDLGWHVAGEMGGIWDHPIKLLDGFTAAITLNGKSYCLDQAETFVNYPFANKHIFRSTEIGLRIERFQYVPDGQEAVLVEYTFINDDSQDKKIDFEWMAYTDLRPTWLGERTDMNDSGDFATWDEENQSWVAKDSLNPWFVRMGSPAKPTAHGQGTPTCNYRPKGKGCRAALVYSLEVPAGGSVSLPITIAGSSVSADEAKATYLSAQQNALKNLLSKKARYLTLSQKSKLTIPDKKLETAFRWVKYDTDWLVRDVPGLGRGLSAGLPDYPWWFGVDNAYTLQGAMATGRTDLAFSTVELLHRLSEKENGNGRIVHEVSTNGAVFNPGNVNETPQFASLIWILYRWSGNKGFLSSYYPVVKKGLAWLLEKNDKDGNLLPDGFGMMEIHGMNSEMVDVAAYTQKAFADAAEMAAEMGEDDIAAKYQNLATQIKAKINSDFWVPEYNSFADFIGTPRQALRLLDDAIVRADTLKKPWAVAELKTTRTKIQKLPPDRKQGFVLHHNWVVNTPMEMGIADTAKALTALKTGSQFVNPYGMFVTGIDRDETAGQDAGSFGKERKVFTYTGAVMTLPTGVQAVAENNYGRPDAALDYLQRITRSFGYALPGSIYEVSPDYGMMTQAWNLYSFAVPIVTQFFGIQPFAARKSVRIQLQMPTSWNEASLENVHIGKNRLSVEFSRTDAYQEIILDQTELDWTLTVAFPRGTFKNWQVNGKAVQPKRVGNFEEVEVTGGRATVRVAN